MVLLALYPRQTNLDASKGVRLYTKNIGKRCEGRSPAAAVTIPIAAMVMRIPKAKSIEMKKALLVDIRPCLSIKPTIRGILAR